MNRTILVASFTTPENLENLLDVLSNKFSISKEQVFLFKNLDENNKIIATFRIVLEDGKKIKLNKYFDTPTIIHKKGNAIYTINALNLLIEKDSGLDRGNINFDKHIIDWNKYQGKMIVTLNNKLTFINISRIL